MAAHVYVADQDENHRYLGTVATSSGIQFSRDPIAFITCGWQEMPPEETDDEKRQAWTDYMRKHRFVKPDMIGKGPRRKPKISGVPPGTPAR